MSIEIMQRVWQSSRMKGTALLLLLAIADNCNKDGEGWPGIDYLAEKTRMSRRQIQRLIQYVETTSELAVEWQAGRGNSNLYHVLTGMPEAEAAEIRRAVAARNECRKGDNLSPFIGVKGDISDTPETRKGDISALKGDRFDVKGDIAMSPEPLNPLTKPKPSGTVCAAQPSPSIQQDKKISCADAWASVRSQLQAEMQRAQYETWIAPLKASSDGQTFRLLAANRYARDWVSSRLGKRIERLVETLYNRPVPIEYSVLEPARV